ncbi:hypothetical protein Poli38472_014133 [Pythium oligandrum]|uniref:Uncharacterized protein n=1 Tax=Pythium oligandrum TaxID=41045 RepID=A0A8K1CJT4_PYTOL|nr:hypothetical protein Poli38472_014133 [Pythium oligandrum]|eukprot:TMW64016.1 hypothetical protein Poli38472_014133 [Pythium oligandrum]
MVTQLLPRVEAPSQRATRIKTLREEAYTQQCAIAVQNEMTQQQQQRDVRFHARWYPIRTMYAVVTERFGEQLQRKSWVRDLSISLSQALVDAKMTLPQLESAVLALLRTTSAPKDIVAALRATVRVFQRDRVDVMDCRELICSLLVLERWQDDSKRKLALWLDVFSVASATGEIRVARSDIETMLFTACAGSDDEKAMRVFVDQLLASQLKSSQWIRPQALLDFADATPAFIALLKSLCWRRLTDDTRLGFYRDLYKQAMVRVEEEESILRLQLAVQLWRLREPRVRFARWKDFVQTCKLNTRGDRRFQVVASRKLVKRFQAHRQRRQEMRQWTQRAVAAYHRSLMRWTLGAWCLFQRSMQQIHRVAWRRSVDHHMRRLRARAWWAYMQYTETERAFKAARQSRLDVFVARRQLKEQRLAWHEWLFVYRRRKEVRDAEQRERALHFDLYEQRLQQKEIELMTVEDAISRAAALKEREMIEAARRRAFQEATDRVYETHKLREQVEARTRNKREREKRVQDEMRQAWARIEAKVNVEVRASTLDWFNTAEGKHAVREEATQIFERDPIVLQKALLQDPLAFGVAGCRWQLQLEDYGGRYAKSFYLNSETLEKIMCDDLVMEDCEGIAKEVLIQRRIDAARDRLRVKAEAVTRERQEHEAAIKIQMLFRCRHALLLTRSRIRTTFVQRIEPSTGDVVYFNILRQETRRRPPRLMGSAAAQIPIESATWEEIATMSAKEQAEEQKQLGNEEFNVKNFDKAIEHYSEAIRLDTENHIYYSNRSAAYGAAGKWELAEEDAKECVRRNPKFAKGYHRLANAQKQLGKNAEAMATLRAAQSSAADAEKVPGIKKLMRDLNQESGAGVSASGNRMVPPAIAKELQELQPQFLNIQRELEQIEAKLGAQTRQKKRLALVEKEMTELPEGTVTYQSIGKMFLQTSVNENASGLKAESTKIDDQISSLEARKNYLARQKTSLEENITELLAQCTTGN